MDYRKESDLKSCCDSQSEKRLSAYRDMLFSDSSKVVFDDQILQVANNYVRDRNLIPTTRAYLNRISDGEGVPFGRSVRSYQNLLQTMEGFQKEEAAPFTWNRYFRRAAEKVCRRYAIANLKPLEYQSNDDIQMVFSDSSTSAGWTWISEGFQHKCDFPVEKLLSRYKQKSKDAVESGTFDSYVILFTRTQCSGEYDDAGNETNTCKHKTRPVWAVDMFTVICELRWAKPLNQFLKNYRFSAIGKDDRTIARWVNAARARNHRWISVDYSKYDSTIPSWLIHEAFKVLAAAFRMNEFDQKLLQAVENDFIHKNAITYDGILHADHGNPSGSGLTAIINGICNELITETWAQKFELGNLEYMIMGDDNLVFLNTNDSIFESVASYISYNFGIKANADKDSEGLSNVNPKFLSRIWRVDGPYRHPRQLISRMLFPERFRDYQRNPGMTPELVFFSYILAYEAGMREAFDVERFMQDNSHLRRKDVLKEVEVVKQMPYVVRQQWAA